MKDAFGETKSGEWYADEISLEVEKLGAETVIHIFLDSAGECVVARRLLNAKYPGIDVGPCAEHCLSLLIKDLLKLARWEKMLQKAKAIAKCIHSQQAVYHEYTAKQACTTIDKFCDIRMGSSVVVLQAEKANRAKLVSTVDSELVAGWPVWV